MPLTLIGMNPFFLKAIIFCAAILPFSQLQAARLFGEFKPGQTIRLVVKERTSLKRVGFSGAETRAGIPANIPKFTVGQTVKFTIGERGQLKVSGFALGFETTTYESNGYRLLPSSNNRIIGEATIEKGINRNASGGTLVFIKVVYAGLKTTTTAVTYTF